MTRLEKDARDAWEGNEIEVLKKRKAELEKLEHELRCSRNAFRRTCIAQEIERLTREYNKIDEMIEFGLSPEQIL